VLLVLDGINERPSFEWRDLFDRLNGLLWRERVAVLVTCRPGYWQESRLMPGQEPRSWTLDGFGDSELDEALLAHGRRRDDFSSDLLPLLRKPRWLDLALRHYDRLEETGDFTIDRLLYEDWKDRLASKRGLTLTDGQFRNLLSDLATRYRTAGPLITDRQIEELLRGNEVDRSELRTGGFLRVESDLVDRYRLEPEWLVYGLGLLLADEINTDADRSDLEELLAYYLEPDLEIDQQADILAAAAYSALRTSGYHQRAKQVLLLAWLSRQNHSRASLERLQAYVPLAVRDYLALLEDSTLYRDLDHRAIERLEYALLAWRSSPKVASALVEHAARWLSFVHPEGFGFMRPMDGPEYPRAVDELKRVIAGRAGSQLQPRRPLFIPGCGRLEVTDSDRFTWLADSALFLLSALPTDGRLAALRQWALSRAVIGHPREWGQVAWLLRRVATPHFEEELFRTVSPLLESPLATARKAGGELLACLGTPRASERRASLPRDVRGIEPCLGENGHAEDPYTGGLHGWRREDCARCSEREDLADLTVARKLSRHALDPDFQIPDVAVPRIRRALDALDHSDVWGDFARTSAESDLEAIEPAAAVAHPATLVNAYRKIVRTQADDEDGWRALSLRLERVHPLLDSRSERAALTKRLHAVHQCSPPRHDQLVHWEFGIFAALIADRPVDEQLRTFLSRPDWAFNNRDLLDLLQPLNEAGSFALLESLPASPALELERRLTLLLAQSSLPLRPEDEEYLCRLLELPEKAANEPSSRVLAVQVVLRAGNQNLWDECLRRGYLHPYDLTFFRERWPGEQRFLAWQTSASYITLRQSIDLATLGYILVANDRLDGDLDRYVDELDTVLRVQRLGRSDPFHPRFRVEFSVDCLRAIVRQRPGVVTEWLDLATNEHLDWPGINFLKATYPFYEALCEALFLERHRRASELYTNLRVATRQEQPVFRDRIGDSLPLVLLRIEVDEVHSHRKAWYQSCGGDMALLDFASATRQHGREDFLVNLIRENVASSNAFERAKALSLAGWCSGVPDLHVLLETGPAEAGSWFASLKSQALSRWRIEAWARSWLTEFLHARSLANSFAAFRLFLRCVDRRYIAWSKSILEEVPKANRTMQRRLRFLTTNHQEIADAIKQNEKDLDRVFLLLRIPNERLAPWTGLPHARQSAP
jgi:hypothetical protein